MIKSHHHNRLLKEKVYRRKGNKKVTLPRDPPISVITFLSYVLSCFSHVQLLAIPWTIACQVPLSMGFSWQGYWSGLPFPSPGYLSDPGTETASPVSPSLAGIFFTTEQSGKPCSKEQLILFHLNCFLWTTVIVVTCLTFFTLVLYSHSPAAVRVTF